MLWFSSRFFAATSELVPGTSRRAELGRFKWLHLCETYFIQVFIYVIYDCWQSARQSRVNQSTTADTRS